MPWVPTRSLIFKSRDFSLPLHVAAAGALLSGNLPATTSEKSQALPARDARHRLSHCDSRASHVRWKVLYLFQTEGFFIF